MTLRSRDEVPEVHYDLVVAIQRAHDGAARETFHQLTIRADAKLISQLFMRLFELNMWQVAKRFVLEYKEPNK